MRLMLGTKDNPSLLVNVKENYDPNHFDFYVVNGAWDGTFYKGHITIHHPWNPWTDLGITEILSDNQDRLRSQWESDYQEVFNNFHNPDYVAPKPKKVELPSYWDDDIPF